jgi:hypothetical protein
VSVAASPVRRFLSPSNIALAVLAIAAVALTAAWAVQNFKSQSLGDRLDEAHSDAVEVTQKIQQGDLSGAESLFYVHIHNLTHEIDFDLRQKDAQLGADLYNDVLAIEGQLAGPRDSAALADQMQKLQGYLLQAKALLAPNG